jgi:hypothetical protein
LLAEGVRVQTEHTEFFRVAGERLADKQYYVDQWLVFNTFCMYGDSFICFQDWPYNFEHDIDDITTTTTTTTATTAE